MRDIELLPVGDNAYASHPAGTPANANAPTDPSFTDTKAYTVPSLGGEFGPGHVPLASGPVDGGVALLAVDQTVTVTAPIKPQPAPTGVGGRAWNPATVLNLYPWHKSPPQGLDSNNVT